jgi:hypothetical protein
MTTELTEAALASATDETTEKLAGTDTVPTRSNAKARGLGRKARLLTIDGLDRRTASYRTTKRLITEIEADRPARHR